MAWGVLINCQYIKHDQIHVDRLQLPKFENEHHHSNYYAGLAIAKSMNVRP